ncbi:MAG: STAS domain-containing protein [Spirochaetota bacterium]
MSENKNSNEIITRMIYSFNKTKQGYILKIEGDLDLYSSYNVKEDVKNQYTIDPDNIIIDLLGLNYIDSAGIGFLIDIHKSASKNGKICEVQNIPGDILKMLRTLRVDTILKIK